MRRPSCCGKSTSMEDLKVLTSLCCCVISLALNFDEYARGWETIGTSLPSDAKDCRDR
jgi:hypothetical protein